LGLAFTCCIAFLLSAAAIRLALPWLAAIGGIADENGRTMHTGRIPKGAGAPMLAAAFAAAAMTSGIEPTIALLAGALAAISLVNDRAHLPSTMRLPVHLAVAGAYAISLPSDAFVFQGLLPFALDRIATAVALAWMMNLSNFMDGINGLAGAETIAIALGYLAVASLATGIGEDMTALAAALAGASAGFLVWNLRRTALAFLGDAGSVPLGFLTGALMIDLAVKGYWAAALILPAYFVVDATSTLIMRIARGEPFWEAHRLHAYQRAASALGSHLAVVARVTVANVALIALALASIKAPATSLIGAALVVALLMLELNRAATAPIRSSGSDPSRR
jgi:UDP-N-acetylmuramyl pentapeptide phosphotransferase/UDP-N-acetylglucosamine-1-phosphate transferase